MADDIKVQRSTEPGDPDVATDDVSGRHFQIVKLAVGSDGVADLVDSTGLPIKATSLPLPSGAATETTLSGIGDKVGNLLLRILQMLMAPLGFDKSLQRYRQTAIIESGTVTTVTTVANLNGLNADMLVRAQVNAAWASNVRARIT